MTPASPLRVHSLEAVLLKRENGPFGKRWARKLVVVDGAKRTIRYHLPKEDRHSTPRKFFDLGELTLNGNAKGPKASPRAFELVHIDTGYTLMLACANGDDEHRAWCTLLEPLTFRGLLSPQGKAGRSADLVQTFDALKAEAAAAAPSTPERAAPATQETARADKRKGDLETLGQLFAGEPAQVLASEYDGANGSVEKATERLLVRKPTPRGKDDGASSVGSRGSGGSDTLRGSGASDPRGSSLERPSAMTSEGRGDSLLQVSSQADFGARVFEATFAAGVPLGMQLRLLPPLVDGGPRDIVVLTVKETCPCPLRPGDRLLAIEGGAVGDSTKESFVAVTRKLQKAARPVTLTFSRAEANKAASPASFAVTFSSLPLGLGMVESADSDEEKLRLLVRAVSHDCSAFQQVQVLDELVSVGGDFELDGTLAGIDAALRKMQGAEMPIRLEFFRHAAATSLDFDQGPLGFDLKLGQFDGRPAAVVHSAEAGPAAALRALVDELVAVGGQSVQVRDKAAFDQLTATLENATRPLRLTFWRHKLGGGAPKPLFRATVVEEAKGAYDGEGEDEDEVKDDETAASLGSLRSSALRAQPGGWSPTKPVARSESEHWLDEEDKEFLEKERLEQARLQATSNAAPPSEGELDDDDTVASALSTLEKRRSEARAREEAAAAATQRARDEAAAAATQRARDEAAAAATQRAREEAAAAATARVRDEAAAAATARAREEASAAAKERARDKAVAAATARTREMAAAAAAARAREEAAAADAAADDEIVASYASDDEEGLESSDDEGAVGIHSGPQEPAPTPFSRDDEADDDDGTVATAKSQLSALTAHTGHTVTSLSAQRSSFRRNTSMPSKLADFVAATDEPAAARAAPPLERTASPPLQPTASRLSAFLQAVPAPGARPGSFDSSPRRAAMNQTASSLQRRASLNDAGAAGKFSAFISGDDGRAADADADADFSAVQQPAANNYGAFFGAAAPPPTPVKILPSKSRDDNLRQKRRSLEEREDDEADEEARLEAAAERAQAVKQAAVAERRLREMAELQKREAELASSRSPQSTHHTLSPVASTMSPVAADVQRREAEARGAAFAATRGRASFNSGQGVSPGHSVPSETPVAARGVYIASPPSHGAPRHAPPQTDFSPGTHVSAASSQSFAAPAANAFSGDTSQTPAMRSMRTRDEDESGSSDDGAGRFGSAEQAAADAELRRSADAARAAEARARQLSQDEARRLQAEAVAMREAAEAMRKERDDARRELDLLTRARAPAPTPARQPRARQGRAQYSPQSDSTHNSTHNSTQDDSHDDSQDSCDDELTPTEQGLADALVRAAPKSGGRGARGAPLAETIDKPPARPSAVLASALSQLGLVLDGVDDEAALYSAWASPAQAGAALEVMFEMNSPEQLRAVGRVFRHFKSGRRRKPFVAAAAATLRAMHSAGALDEAALLSWHDADRKKRRPYVNWLIDTEEPSPRRRVQAEGASDPWATTIAAALRETEKSLGDRIAAVEAREAVVAAERTAADARAAEDRARQGEAEERFRAELAEQRALQRDTRQTVKALTPNTSPAHQARSLIVLKRDDDAPQAHFARAPPDDAQPRPPRAAPQPRAASPPRTAPPRAAPPTPEAASHFGDDDARDDDARPGEPLPLGLPASAQRTLRERFLTLLQLDRGYLLDDEDCLVDVRVEHGYDAHRGRCFVTVRNRSDLVLHDVSVDVFADDDRFAGAPLGATQRGRSGEVRPADRLRIALARPYEPQSLQPGASTMREVVAECAAPFVVPPELTIRFRHRGMKHAYALRLPVAATCFSRPNTGDARSVSAFRARWDETGAGEGREQQVVVASRGAITPAMLTDVAERMFRATLQGARVRDADRTPYTLTAAATVCCAPPASSWSEKPSWWNEKPRPSSKPGEARAGDVPVLFRLEANVHARAFRLTVRSPAPDAAAAFKNVLQALLTSYFVM
ncbi:hypothetical protein M885DRAFT_616947 [Pelagophyceae sp. CCMP2097]|nr:hypothetical protein M885DRAFT_616947 [Pelagophyceae sp. CCMP2097]